MSLQAGKELPDVTEVGAPPESIPQKIEPVIHSTNVGSKARLVTLDVTRDRGKEKGEDRAAISYTKMDASLPFDETVRTVTLADTYAVQALALTQRW